MNQLLKSMTVVLIAAGIFTALFFYSLSVIRVAQLRVLLGDFCAVMAEP